MLLERAAEIRQPKRREALVQNADKARLSRMLVTLDAAVPLDAPIEHLAVVPLDGAKLVAFLKGLEFTALTRRVAEATGCDAAAVPSAVAMIW